MTGFAFSSAERYLQMEILNAAGASQSPPQIILPRQQLLSVPYAIEAQKGVPPGTILPYGGITAPSGYLMCDGKLFDKAAYPRLAFVLNTTSGAAFGGDTTKFNVPDLRGRFLRGTDDPDGAATNFGDAGRDPDRHASTNNGADGKRYVMAPGGNTGNAVGSLQMHAMLSHNHSQNPHSHGHSLDNVDGYQGVLIQTGLF